MLFQLNNLLNVFDDELLSYAFDIQTLSPYDYRHGKIVNGEYCITFSGSYHIVKSPEINSFSLSANVRHGSPFYPSQDIVWGVAFALQDHREKYYELTFSHQPKGQTNCVLYAVEQYKKRALWKKSIAFALTPESFCFSLSIKDGVLNGALNGVAFDGEAPEILGKVAFFRTNGLKEMFLSNLHFEGETAFEPKLLTACRFDIPYDCGNFFPYSIVLRVEQVGETLCKLSYSLERGTLHPLTDAYFDPRYGGGAIREELESPYLRINGGKKLYLSRDRLLFMEGDDLRFDELNVIYNTIMRGQALPMQGEFYLDYHEEKIENFSFGHSRFFFVNTSMYSRKREYVFATDGQILYNGEDLDNVACVRTYSPVNERLLSQFPDDLLEREWAVEHLKGNHYFHEDEKVRFESVVHSTKDADLLSYRCCLQDAFFTHICDLEIKKQAPMSALNKHNAVKLSVEAGYLKTGVYNFVTEVFYAGESVNKHVSTFEVFDLDGTTTPQDASGLPTIWVRDGINTSWGYPNPWNTQPDENTAHYFQIAMWRPSSADKIKAWELLRVYRKKLLIWATSRCDANEYVISPDFLQTGVVKNTDYLNLYFPGLEDNNVVFYRHDYYMYHTYDSKSMRDMLQNFIDENPHIACKLSFQNAKDGISREQFTELLSLCHREWIAYAQPRVDRLFEEQWAKVKKQNPNIKRHSYGPYSIYASNVLSGYSIKWFGKNVENMHEHFDLFQFEDYPFSCSYATHYSAWCIATVRYYNDKVTIGPELYDSLLPGCSDGFVACAKPPQGMHKQLPYMTNTQLSEYIFNSAVLTENGFDYWRDDTFALISSGMMENGEQRIKEYLPEYKVMIDNRPKAHKKAIAILFDIREKDDDLFTEYFFYSFGERNFGNISEAGLQHIHAVARQNGYDCFLVKPNALHLLNTDNCAMLALPSMDGQSDSILNEVQRIHGMGIPLICVGNTGKLNTLFGVEEDMREVRLTKLKTAKEEELIDNTVCRLWAKPTNAETLVYGDGDVCIVSQKDNCLAIHAPLTRVGVDSYRQMYYVGRCQISKILKTAVKNFFDEQISPIAICRDNVGVTVFESVKNQPCILLVDYIDNDPDKEGKSRIVTVEFDSEKVKDIALLSKENRTLHKLFDTKGLKAIRVQIRTHEEVLMKLIES